MKKCARIGTAFVVLAVYVYLATGGRFELRFVDYDTVPKDYYHFYVDLAEGFRRGELSLASRPHPDLINSAKCSDPYSQKARGSIPYLWDVSLYGGRYYLYFTPLPALVLLSGRVILGRYPDPVLPAIAFAFGTWLMWAAFLRRITPSGCSLAWWLLVDLALAFGSMTPFILMRHAVYETAIAAASFFAAAASYALCRCISGEWQKVGTMGLGALLALAINARPNFGLMLPVFFLMLWFARTEPIKHRFAMVGVTSLPIIGMLLIMALYNHYRFGSLLDFGFEYALEWVPLKGIDVFGTHSGFALQLFLLGLKTYLIGAPKMTTDFPYLYLRPGEVHAGYHYLGLSGEAVGGTVLLFPWMAAAFLAPFVLLRHRRSSDPAIRFAGFLFACGMVSFIFLCFFFFKAARYEMEFVPFFLAGALLTLRIAINSDAGRPGFFLKKTIVALSLLVAAVNGLLIAFSGMTGYRDVFPIPSAVTAVRTFLSSWQ